MAACSQNRQWNCLRDLTSSGSPVLSAGGCKMRGEGVNGKMEDR